MRRRRTFKQWVTRNRRSIIRISSALIILFLLVQLFYPSGTMLPFARVDGRPVGGQTKADVIRKLDELSSKQRLNIALGTIDTKFRQPNPSEIGLKISNQQRINDASYPWYMRIIPTSLLWFGLLQNEQTPSYKIDTAKTKAYVASIVGESCVIAAKDASVQLNGNTLSVVKAKAGGKCQTDQAVKALGSVKPRINKPTTVTIDTDVTAPLIGDSEAKRVADKLNDTTKNGVKIKVSDKRQTIAQREVLSWLTFKSSGGYLAYDIDQDKAGAYLAKNVTPAIAKPAGVTKVSTYDFTETSRSDGATGQTLALAATLESVRKVLDGEQPTASAVPSPLPPKVEATRSYSKSGLGLSALLKFYDDDNNGSFGVSFAELGGQGLSAQHDGDKQFVTASTYKLFVAFSTLKRVDGGQMKWDDANIASGRNLSTCFDDMIVKSDNACAEALIKKIGAKDLNADIKSLGLNNTAFKADNNVTTANDLVNYLTQLEKGQMPIKPESRERLLAAMKRNVYRKGIPAGASGQTADKVGFLNGLLHDAAIVYSPKGTYVLVILTDGSSWANIADLTRQIEALR